MSDPARVVVVRLCVEELWASRGDGRFAALEDALVDVLNSKKSRPDKTARGALGTHVTKPRSTAVNAMGIPEGDNVINFSDRRRQREARRAAP